MRILVYNWRDMAHPRAGGAEVYTHNVAKHWVEWGHEVTWFTSAVEGRPSVEEVDGIKIVRRGGRLGVYREARRFYQKEGKGRFDVVLDEINTRPFLCPRYVEDVPVVGLIHQVCREVWFYESALPIAVVGRYWLEPRWLRDYRGVRMITVSESSRDSLALYDISDVEVVPEGWSAPQLAQLGPKESTPTVMFLGRLTANKRPTEAIAAYELARKEIPALQMWVVGSGPLERKLRRSASPSVQFFGRVTELEKYDLLARSHALLVTSVREGWGLVVSEAAAVGTGAIAYDVPGLRDAVTASEGHIVATNPEAMADQIVLQLSGGGQGAPRAPTQGGTVIWAETAERLMHHFAGAKAEEHRT